ncbi:MAG: asparagine synthase-related protein [Desulfobacteraceae bacterium]|jgi:asparagine synthase (glutamine-hydrolysing)
MSEIFGFVNINAESANIEKLLKMQAVLDKFPSDSRKVLVDRNSAMGFHQLCITAESRFENIPLHEKESGSQFTAEARLDNRDELCDMFGIPISERHFMPDTELVYRAWKKWEENCPEKLFGDWSFAFWNGRTGKLTVARDHIGNTGLFYYYKAPLFVFASSLGAVLAHPDVRNEMDEKQLACFMVNDTRGDLKNTLWKNVSKLLPSQVISVDSDGLKLKRFWNFEEVQANKQVESSQCLETFLSLFERAVAGRRRSLRTVSSTLSAGLDSTAVTALAAEQAYLQGGKILAFTYKPLNHPNLTSFGKMPDEWNLAHTVARKYVNIEHRPISGEQVSPLDAIRRSIHLFKSPPHALANMFWINDMMDVIRKNNSDVLLTGQMGNAVISWNGGSNRIVGLFIQGKWDQGMDALIQWKKAQNQSLLTAVKTHLLAPFLKRMIKRKNTNPGFFRPMISRYSVISKDLSERTGLFPSHPTGLQRMFSTEIITPREERIRSIRLNSAYVGPFWHGMGTAYGIEVRDPTVDVRLLEFCLGVPDDECVYGGGQRMLVRRAMKGIVPDEVRWNRIRGNQAADIGLRLLVHAEEVERELMEIENSKLMQAYINVSAMRTVWGNFKSSQNPQNLFWLSRLFLRGYAASVFLRCYFPMDS